MLRIRLGVAGDHGHGARSVAAWQQGVDLDDLPCIVETPCLTCVAGTDGHDCTPITIPNRIETTAAQLEAPGRQKYRSEYLVRETLYPDSTSVQCCISTFISSAGDTMWPTADGDGGLMLANA